jgi:hypothetical protein
MPAAMEVTQEPDFSPRPVREHGSLLVLALLAFAVGGTSGLLGAVFRLVLDRSDRFPDAVIDWAHGKEITGFVLVIGISAIATGLAAWLVRKFAPGAKGSGIPDVEAVLRDEQPSPTLILIPVKFLGGVLAMGAGLALGREGPTVQMGAGIGHFLATAFRRNQDDVKALLAAGAAAGLATAFSAPVAGAVFVLEELVRRFDTRITVTTLCDVHLFNPNPLGRYSLGTKNKNLKYNADGSLTLYASVTSPGADKESNWLPAPAGTFCLYIRCYSAEQAVLDGTWQPPQVEKVKTQARAQETHFDKLANLPFAEGRPTKETAQTLRDELLFQRATQTYLWAMPLFYAAYARWPPIPDPRLFGALLQLRCVGLTLKFGCPSVDNQFTAPDDFGIDNQLRPWDWFGA